MTSETLPHWNLSTVYLGLGSKELAQSIQRLESQIEDLDTYLSHHQIAQGGPVSPDPATLAGVIGGYLDRMNALHMLSDTLRNYVYAFVATDSYNTTARRTMSELEAKLVCLERQEVLFRGWIGTVAEQPGALEAALAEEGPAGDHAFHLQETAEQSRYLMSVAEETLASELALSGARAWEKLQGVVTSQLKVPFEQDGLVETLPITVVQTMRTHPEDAIRRLAYEAELAGWESVREPLAACLNGIKGAVNTLGMRRGRSDALHTALDHARIDRKTLEAMLGAMRDSFPAFRRYWQTKAQLLGKESLPWWDLFAPVGNLERRYTFAEAREMILGQLSTFSDRIAIFSRRAFDENWIDAEPRDGKVGGAFCMRLPAADESRILCNFDGSLDEVLTLAHELGHAYHNECQVGKAPLQRRTPMTLAETASIFNETLVTDAILAQGADEGDELAILETFLIGASQVVVDIHSRYLFETEVFERRAKAELSADDLCGIMLRAQKETYGTGLDTAHLNPYMWAWKSHYYSPVRSFYNFPYAFGLLFSLGLYSIYREQGEAFASQYDELLRSTGEGRASELASRFGVDIRRRSFWEASLKAIETRIERYCVLAARRHLP
jgi:pepF/M3 family oligoendopeptidase